MSFSYTFTKTVTKANAFDAYLTSNFTDATLVEFIQPDTVLIQSAVELTTEQQAELAALIAAYTDPSVYLVLSGTETLSGVSESTNSTSFRDVQAFIYPSLTLPNGDNVRQDGSVLDQIKVILKLFVADVSTVADLSSGSVGVQLYNKTQNSAVGTQTVDVSTLLQQFQTAALASQTGPMTAYQTVQIYSLRNYAYQSDCVWVFRLSSPDSRINVSTNGFQKLFFIAQ